MQPGHATITPGHQPNIMAALFGLAVLAFFTTLYLLRRDLYFTVLDWWSFRPFRYPFIDLVYLPAQVSCWNSGIDVYAANPCDPLNRVHDYSPLWLRMSFLANASSFVDRIGLALDAVFMLSLAALPRPRRAIDYLPLLIAIVSPMTLFALERGNIDTLMFLLAIAAVVCMDRALPVRILGYSLIMLAALLKFYPFVLFILLLRERFRTFLIAATAAACAMAAFLWAYADEVKRMLHNVPQPSSFTDAFGAAQLPAGIGILTQRLLQHAGASKPPTGIVELPVTVLLVVGAYATARHLARRQDLQTAMGALTQREYLALVAGAVLMCGCFLSGRSIGYREIMLLLAIPGLSALARTSPSPAISQVFRVTTWIAVFLMSFLPLQRLIYNLLGSLAQEKDSVLGIAFWLIREMCWWWLVTILATVLVRFVLDSSVGRGLIPQKKRSNQAIVSAGASSAM